MSRTAPDGIRFNLQHATYSARMRLPMDHGGGIGVDEVKFRLWDVRFDGDRAVGQPHTVPHIWRGSWQGIADDPHQLLNPSFLMVDGHPIANGCAGQTLATVSAHGTTCLDATAAPQIRQIGGRIERVTLSGTRLTFADGLDGRSQPCTLDLASIAKNAARPLRVDRFAANGLITNDEDYAATSVAGFRFSVSYLPPTTAFVTDHGVANHPVWRATCTGFKPAGHILPLPEGTIRPGSEGNPMGVEILDMVDDPGSVRPALFLALPDGEYGHRLAVWREGRALQLIPYYCHDCLPAIGGFFRGDPDWLLFEAKTGRQGGNLALRLTLFDVAGSREVQRLFVVTDRNPGIFQ